MKTTNTNFILKNKLFCPIKRNTLNVLFFSLLILFTHNLQSQCPSNATSTSDEEILNVTFGTLNNTSSCATTGGAGSILNEYSDYAFAGFTGGIPNVDRGCTIPFSIQIGTCGGNYGNSIAIYIDWNNNLSFTDPGENVYLSAASTTGPHTETGTITIPSTATLGNCGMRIVNVEGIPSSITPCGSYTWGETEDYFINITNGGGIAPYISSSVTQIVSGSVSQCANLQQIICIPIVIGSGCNAGSITQFLLGSGSSTNLLADVSKIHIYYTGTNNSFFPTNEFVAGGTTPTGASNTINGSQTLVANATNYFWIAYDMNPLSTIGNTIDGSCSQITVGGINQTPTTTNPAGSGVITICPCSFNLGSDVSLCAPVSYTINGPSGYNSYVWNPGGATTQNLAVTSPGNYTCTATIINGGLVVNGDFSSGNTGFTTNYIVGTGGAWGPVSNPGTYSVTTNPNSAHSNFMTFGDHTTGTGNMMVINGANTANTIVWSQTITVTPNTNYNFSAWFASPMNESSTDPAQLQFSINGVLIGPVNNAPLTGGVWSNFFVNWNSGSNTSAIITIVDQNNLPSSNNDFVLDDITFERVCTSSDAIAINVIPTPTVTVPMNIIACNTNSIAISTFTGNPVGTSFTWTNSNTSIGLTANGSSNTPQFTATNTGTTAITATVTVTPSYSGCIGSPKPYTITVNPSPTISSSTTNSIICIGGSTSLTGNGASTYTWSNGISNGVAFSPTTTTTYTVIGTSALGCTNTAVQTITVSASPTITVNSSTICQNSNTLLTANGATNYTWSPSATLSSSNTSTVTASPTITTIYSIIGSIGTCTTSGSSTVTVNTSPTITVNSPTICTGSSALLTANGATTYTWNTTATTQTITVSPASNTVYTVTGTTSGCSSFNTATVTIGSSILITVNSPSICSGSATTLTASGANNYTWSPSATLSSPNSSLVIASPITTTIYNIVGTIGTCTTSGSSTVTVNSNPTVTANTSNSVICMGNTTSLTGGGASTYTWTGGVLDGAAFSPTTTATYTVTGSSIAGCTNTAVQTITVNTSPTITVNSPTLCAGSSALLTANGATTYTWNTTATTQTINVFPVSNTIYSVTGTSNGCSSFNTATVSVYSNPTVTANSANSVICSGNSTSLIGGGASTYTWTGGVVDGTAFYPTTTSTYTVIGTSIAGCTNTAVQTITVINTPSVSVTTSSICNGQSASITATPSTIGGVFVWTPSGQNSPSITVSPPNSTVYAVLYTLNGCTTTATGSITVYQNPLITLTPSSTSISSLETITILATGGGSYSWNTGQSTSMITVNPQITTNYCVTVTSVEGCISSNCVNITVINESTLYMPNIFTPNGDGINDVYFTPSQNIVEYNLNIFNRWGQIIFNSTEPLQGWDGRFNGVFVPDGVYVYILKAKGGDDKHYENAGHITVIK